jgi:hypothetical protein
MKEAKLCEEYKADGLESRFSAPAGEIRVSAKLRKSQIGQDEVAVTVSDTGKGRRDPLQVSAFPGKDESYTWHLRASQ